MTDTVEPPPAPKVSGVPVVATLIVMAAMCMMIALGVWQLSRHREKTALLSVYAANERREAAMPAVGPVPDELLFRTTRANCLKVTQWRQIGGRARDGSSGFRFLATCGTGAEGPGFVVDAGVSEDPHTRVAWTGGVVEGILVGEPVEGGLLAQLFGNMPVARPMIVATNPAPDLKASAPPDPSSVPNNHLSYAVQWFVFAGVAGIIYLLALRKRRRG